MYLENTNNISQLIQSLKKTKEGKEMLKVMYWLLYYIQCTR